MSSGGTCYSDGAVLSNTYYCTDTNWLVCDLSRECGSSTAPWYCHYGSSGWDWGYGDMGLPSGWTEICGDGHDNDCNGSIDYCDDDCSCSSGERLGCSQCVSCSSSVQAESGGSITVRNTLVHEAGLTSGTCSFYPNDGSAFSTAGCEDGRYVDHEYICSSPSTFNPYWDEFKDDGVTDMVYCPDVRCRIDCPGKVDGETGWGCESSSPGGDTQINNTDYFCAGANEDCYECVYETFGDQFIYDSGEDECLDSSCQCTSCDPFSGEWKSVLGCDPPGTTTGGCTDTLGTGETEMPTQTYCAGDAVCIECQSGYNYKYSDLKGSSSCGGDCVPECPAAQTGTIYAGQHATQPDNSYGPDVCTYLIATDEDDCYLCNTDYEWDGSSTCCMSNAQSGSDPTCGGDADCCSNHCAQHDPDGVVLGSGDWHCCDPGYGWHVLGGACQQAQLCSPPCTNDISEMAWWETTDCITQTKACCMTDVFGDSEYHWIPNLTY